MAQVLVIGRIHEAGLAVLAQNGLTCEVIAGLDDDAALAKVAEADGILIRTAVLTEAAVAPAHRLRVVSRHGVGYDNVPVAALSARGVPVMIVGPVNAVSVAEQTLAMMLALAKRLVPYDRSVRSGDWVVRDELAIFELASKVLLLLGFGRISGAVAERARAFGMTVLAHDPFVSAEAMGAAGVTSVAAWRDVIGEADFVSLHLPFTADTRNTIDADALAAMKRSAFLLNLARGGLVDEDALHRALVSGGIAGAALDTFAAEPPPIDDPLLGLPNVILSPHSAGLTEEAAMRMAVAAAENVVAALRGNPDPALTVNWRDLPDAAGS